MGSCTPFARAASFTSPIDALSGLATSMAITLARGTSSDSSSNRLDISSETSMLKPVTLQPGRA